MPLLEKTLIGLGLVLIVAGLAVLYGPKLPFLGHLPGDIYIEKENFKLYFPLTTGLLLSALVSLIVFIFLRFK